MTFQCEALPKAKFSCFHDFGFVPLLDDGHWGAFANHPEVVGGDVESDAAGGTLAGAAGREGCGEGLVLDVLQVEAVPAEELVARVHDSG
jgi:hypothetical protein